MKSIVALILIPTTALAHDGHGIPFAHSHTESAIVVLAVVALAAVYHVVNKAVR